MQRKHKIPVSTILIAIIAFAAGAAITSSVIFKPTPTTQPTTQATANRGNCDPSYPTVCIPPPPPDLDCKDISYRNFQVLPPDPHRFDGDHDGIGCET